MSQEQAAGAYYNHKAQYVSQQLARLAIEDEAHNAKRIGAALPKDVVENEWATHIADWSMKKTTNRRVKCLVKAYENILPVQKVVNFIRPSEADELLDQLEKKKAKALGFSYHPNPRPPLEPEKSTTMGKSKLNPFHKLHFADDMKDEPIEEEDDVEEEFKTEPWVDRNFPPTEGDTKNPKFEREDPYKYHGIEVKPGGKVPKILNTPAPTNPMKYAPVSPPTFTKQELDQAQAQERLPVFFYGSYQFPDICSRGAQIPYPMKLAGNYTPARLNEHVSLAVRNFHMPAAVPVASSRARSALQEKIGEILDMDDQQNVKGFKELHEHLGENELEHQDKAAPRALLNVKGFLVFGLTAEQKALIDKQFRLLYKHQIVEVDFYVKLPPPENIRVHSGVRARATAQLKTILRPRAATKASLPLHPAMRGAATTTAPPTSRQASLDKTTIPAAEPSSPTSTRTARTSSEKSGSSRLRMGIRKVSSTFKRGRSASGEASSVASSRAQTPSLQEGERVPVSFPANPVVHPPKRGSLALKPGTDGGDSDVTATGLVEGPLYTRPEHSAVEGWAPGAEVLVRTRAHVWVYKGPQEELVGPSVRPSWDWEDRLGEAMEAGGFPVPGHEVKGRVM
ncbi:MAG: hypothetical protein M1831_003336 [Alyxoria varia]|nr:MAG: hypothetical protein M1831_003336 [Alyxoria varia]